MIADILVNRNISRFMEELSFSKVNRMSGLVVISRWEEEISRHRKRISRGEEEISRQSQRISRHPQ